MATFMCAIGGWLTLSCAATALLFSGCGSSRSQIRGHSDAGAECNGFCADSGADAHPPVDAKLDGQGSDSRTADVHDAANDKPDGKQSDSPIQCEPQPLPPDVPEGWEEYPLSDCQYRVYVPSSPQYLPPPLIWEPCTSTIGPLPYDCRQIRQNWPSLDPAPYSLAWGSKASVEPDGRVVLQFRKVYTPTTGNRPTISTVSKLTVITDSNKSKM